MVVGRGMLRLVVSMSMISSWFSIIGRVCVIALC